MQMHISVFVCAVLVVRFIHLSSGVKIKFGHHRPRGICITQDLILLPRCGLALFLDLLSHYNGCSSLGKLARGCAGYPLEVYIDKAISFPNS